MPEATDLILLSPSSHKMQFSAICHLLFIYFFTVHLVQAERLGLSRIAPLAPKASAYTNSATPACPAFMADSYSFLLILSDLSIKKRGGVAVKQSAPRLLLSQTYYRYAGGLWLYYGITLVNIPLIVGNSIKLFSSLSVLAVAIWIKRKKQ